MCESFQVGNWLNEMVKVILMMYDLMQLEGSYCQNMYVRI